MALTDVLSNIFNYFVQWHRDNYDALHKKTNDQINDINNNKIGTKNCSKVEGNSLWDAICFLKNGWDQLGYWNDSDGNDFVVNRTDRGDNAVKTNSAMGWIRILDQRFWDYYNTYRPKIEANESKINSLVISKWAVIRFHPNFFEGFIVGGYNWIDVQFRRYGNVCTCVLLQTRMGQTGNNYKTQYYLNDLQGAGAWTMLNTRPTEDYDYPDDATVIRQMDGNLDGRNSYTLSSEILKWFCPTFDVYMAPHNTNKVKYLKLFNDTANGGEDEGYVHIEVQIQNTAAKETGPIGGSCTYICRTRFP